MTDLRKRIVAVLDLHGFIDYPRLHCDGDDWEPGPSQPFFTDHLADEIMAVLPVEVENDD